MTTNNAMTTLTICICTMDRPELLRRCLQSIADSPHKPDEVIVSDDSRQPDATVALCAEFAFARYVRGPQRGLCANRNVAIRACTGESVSLMDDDAILSPDFVSRARERMSAADGRTIFTGSVQEYGQTTKPRNPSFWGHFTLTPAERYETINLNCNVFPRAALAAAQFDETIVYGYEDMDLCSHLLTQGYRIEFAPELTNPHVPPPDNSGLLPVRHRQAELARFYTSLRRYGTWQNKPGKAVAYALLAPLHRIAFDVKIRDWADIPQSVKDMQTALRMVRAAGIRNNRIYDDHDRRAL